jgi:hypothetical protein
MLLGKLSTPASKVYQAGPFETTTILGEYITVSINTFVIGSSSVIFELRFGNIITENEQERFDIVIRDLITLTNDELAEWGTDDAVLLDLVAAKLNNSITEKITREDFHHTY